MTDGRAHGQSAVPAGRWQHEGVTATAVQCPVGLRRRRTAPGVELSSGDVQVRFLSRELADFFAGRTDNLESWGRGATYFLYLVSAALPPAGEQTLAGVPHGSITLLAAAPRLLTPVFVLPPDAAADLSRWFRALP